MVNTLYAVSAFTYALVLIAILVHDIRINKAPEKIEYTFRIMVAWVIFFCLQDTIWGICASSLVKSDMALMIASTVFHSSTVLTTFFWLKYILTYLGDNLKKPYIYLIIDGIIIMFQAGLLVANFFKPTIFYVGMDGTYCTAFLRPFAVLNQYIVYLAIGIGSVIHAIRTQGEKRIRFLTAFLFALAPILSGAFQYLYPDGPFYSIGYFLGCFIIHIFIVTEDRDSLIQIKHQQKMAEQIAISNTDELTHLYNRRSYENDLKEYAKYPIPDNFVYISADLNGLKQTNDSLGHSAGDELIVGAANCLQNAFAECGKTYRVGGDEFVSIIFANSDQLVSLVEKLNTMSAQWKGNIVKELTLSLGIIEKCNYPDSSIDEIAKLADQAMYKAKAEYYMKKGIDRRGNRTAYAAICASYTKILKINLTEDSYQIIKTIDDEKTDEKGFSNQISKWLHDFGLSGLVHKDDLDEYLRKTDIDYLKKYFKENKKSINMFYRRRISDTYRQVMMELIPTEEYADTNQVLYLYVKDIDK